MPVRLVGNEGQTKVSGFSNIDGGEGRSGTATHLSTNISLLVNGVAVAAIKNITINENRPLTPINEVGTDGHIDSAPTGSTTIDGSIKRTRFDRQRVAEAFGRGFVHVAAQRIPFDIEIQDNFQGSDDASIIITTVRNVWIKSITVAYDSDNFVIVEDMGWMAESIDSVRGDGESPVVGNPNNRGVPLEINPFETEADIGQYRGALDAAGLINAFDGPGGREV